MNQARIISAILFVALFAGIIERSTARALSQQSSAKPLRVAAIGFVGVSTGNDEATLYAALAKDERVVLIESSQLQPALNGIGYKGSLNLSVKEAQGIGAAIGCDFFILGRADTAIRSEAANESHVEALLGVMVVDSRSGALAYFDFILEKAASREAAQRKAAQTLASRASLYIEKMYAFRAAREAFAPPASKPVEEMPDTESAMAAGFKAPEFLNRVKPDYPDEASLADITATVEAKAVFQADGEVGEIEIVRWAGFGLEEAAMRAIRQLKFKPARRDGKAISVRALIRYNFRRVNEK
jgi:TonB family protein